MSDLLGRKFDADDLDKALRQLCWIPVFGGGFGMRYEDALRFPINKVEAWLAWAEQRRK